MKDISSETSGDLDVKLQELREMDPKEVLSHIRKIRRQRGGGGYVLRLLARAVGGQA